MDDVIKIGADILSAADNYAAANRHAARAEALLAELGADTPESRYDADNETLVGLTLLASIARAQLASAGALGLGLDQNASNAAGSIYNGEALRVMASHHLDKTSEVQYTRDGS